MTEPITLPELTGADVDVLLHPDHAPSGPGSAAAAPTSSAAPLTKREREAQWMSAALDMPDLTAVSLADLRVLANRMFRILDSDRPPLQASERYAAAIDEIEDRSRRIAARGDGPGLREVFKDSGFTSRFELYFDGSLAAYLRYSMLGGQLTLRALVEKPGFEGRGLGRVLLRHAMLNAHKRRLSVVPGCAPAQAFIEQNPQYRLLARMPR
ncbi:N-acetyltransferase [Arthrobacter agilis]|uniref:GNAT family N-acetyltransferase n=1 Tax=Arthrobacter agilis TaxID=37921 RepID=UPI0023664E27|nr:N-acetyltransferase [Arthrobacter agilis]WDF33032.1 N-acetyltransferase [Arthrobacter agilis]